MEILPSVYISGFLILVFIIVLIIAYLINRNNKNKEDQDLIDSRKENDGDTTLDQ